MDALHAYLSKPQDRKVQVLERGKGFCKICNKETKHVLVYVFSKVRVPIFLLIVIVGRSLPAFYGVVCDNCGTVLARMTNEKALKEKYEWSRLSGNHHKAKETPKIMELMFIQMAK